MPGAPAPPFRPAPLFRIEHLAEVDSTNDIVRARAEAGEPEGLVVTATAQRKGRGRHGRSWTSPLGNLYTSILLRPQAATAQSASLSLVIALALAEAIGERATLKWPNDVLIDGAKTAGILLEATEDAIIAGIGVNITTHPTDTPYRTTSLAASRIDHTGPTLLAALLAHLPPRYAAWQAEGFGPLRTAWLARATGLDAPTSLRRGNTLIQGRLTDLADDGSITLQYPDGQTEQHTTGELLFG